MKVLVSTSAKRIIPEEGKVYWLHEKEEHIKQGRTITNWVQQEKAIRVVSVRGGKVMIKNAFGSTTQKARGIAVLSIGTKVKFVPYVRPSKQTAAEKDQATTQKVANDTKLKGLLAKQKELRKELAAIEKQIDKLTELRKPVDRSGKNSGGYAELAAYILKDVKKPNK